MKILLASSEVHPYSKTGGLADMVGALAKALARRGHEAALVTPLYRGVRERFPDLQQLDLRLDLPLGNRQVRGNVWARRVNDQFTLYFVDQPDFYQRSSLYQWANADYPDNAERYIFLSKAVVYLARHLPIRPELVHVHDWHLGLVPLLLQHEQRTTRWSDAPPTCMTIHNLAYQGVFPTTQYPLTNLPWDYFNPEGVEFYGRFNCLKAGLAYAQVVTAVSPRYAREITTQEFGCGLDGLLRRRQAVLFGILNGVDYEEWNTTDNPFLNYPYSIEDLSGKTADKLELQKELGLPADETIPLFGSISRLVDQKGVDIQLAALEEMLSGNIQFVLLGTGVPEYETGYRQLAQRHSSKVAVRIGYDQGLAHRIEAGCDFFPMPSRFEPCGLNQMYSLRYGTVPIVRATGGLDDTVIDLTEDPEHADGIKFAEYSSRALAKGMRKALALYDEPQLLRHFQFNGMSVDFSWDRTARQYEEVYRRARK
jgi:starch synthase